MAKVLTDRNLMIICKNEEQRERACIMKDLGESSKCKLCGEK